MAGLISKLLLSQDENYQNLRVRPNEVAPSSDTAEESNSSNSDEDSGCSAPSNYPGHRSASPVTQRNVNSNCSQSSLRQLSSSPKSRCPPKAPMIVGSSRSSVSSRTSTCGSTRRRALKGYRGSMHSLYCRSSQVIETQKCKMQSKSQKKNGNKDTQQKNTPTDYKGPSQDASFFQSKLKQNSGAISKDYKSDLSDKTKKYMTTTQNERKLMSDSGKCNFPIIKRRSTHGFIATLQQRGGTIHRTVL